jgi:hypothetical protein
MKPVRDAASNYGRLSANASLFWTQKLLEDKENAFIFSPIQVRQLQNDYGKRINTGPVWLQFVASAPATNGTWFLILI